MVLEKTPESPLDCKEIKPVHPKGNQHWIFIGRTDAEAEAPVLWPPDMKSQLIRKDPDAGKDWRQEDKKVTEDEMVGWHHWLSGCQYEQILGYSEGPGSLKDCSPWGHKESDMTWQLNNSKKENHEQTATYRMGEIICKHNQQRIIISKIHKQHIQFNIKKPTTQSKNEQKI